eukprot:Sspe_Gene.94135::Locus_66589_Transcript_2_3_Confidence_0.429_Length_2337::g.94135::m.94135
MGDASVVVLLVLLTQCGVARGGGRAPSLDDLGSDWYRPDTELRDLPSINNFWGSLGTDPQEHGLDVVGVSGVQVGEWAGCGRDLEGRNQCGVLSIDSEVPKVQVYRWKAFEAIRRASTSHGLAVESRVRMEFEGTAVMWEVDISNPAAGPVTCRVTFSMAPLFREYATLGWVDTLPANASEFTVVTQAGATVIQDTRSPAVSAVVQDFQSKVELGGNSTKTLRMVMAVGNQSNVVLAHALGVMKDFPSLWSDAQVKWEERWQSAFDPRGTHFTGNLPLLSLPDHPRIERVYYMAALTVLSLERTVYSSSFFPRSFVTGSGNPSRNRLIGGSAQWFWDTSLHAFTTALLDPAVLRKYVSLMLAVDFHSGNNVHLDTPHPPLSSKYGFYAFNPWAYSLIITSYLRATNDTALLGDPIPDRGQTVDQLLDYIAYNWTEYRLHVGSNLADYGPSPGSFLECVPTYINAVPAIQANNVWMLRALADLRLTQGNTSGAAFHMETAAQISHEMRERMYIEGKGYWYVIHPNGTKREMRHIIDFFSVAWGLCGGLGVGKPCDLDETTKRDMVSFVQRELATSTWTRALSPFDPTQPYISRPDHGTTGAYAAWPAYTIESLCRLGACRFATELLANISTATREGPFGQAHGVPQDPTPPYTPHNDKAVFKTTGGANRYFEDNGGSFMDVIIRVYFGFSPPLVWPSGSNITAVLDEPSRPREIFGTLTNLRTPMGLAEITSSSHGLVARLLADP